MYSYVLMSIDVIAAQDFMSAHHFLARACAVAVGCDLDVHALLRLGALNACEVVVAHALNALVFFQLLNSIKVVKREPRMNGNKVSLFI